MQFLRVAENLHANPEHQNLADLGTGSHILQERTQLPVVEFEIEDLIYILPRIHCPTTIFIRHIQFPFPKQTYIPVWPTSRFQHHSNSSDYFMGFLSSLLYRYLTYSLIETDFSKRKKSAVIICTINKFQDSAISIYCITSERAGGTLVIMRW